MGSGYRHRLCGSLFKKNATSTTMKKISQGTVLSIPFPSGLILREQRQMVRELKTVKTRIERSKQLQKRSASEVDAILPSIIDMAFRGEL